MFRTNNANPVEALMEGHISDGSSHTPVSQATVSVSGITVDVGDQGYYLTDLDLPDGTYDVTATAPGYAPETQPVYLETDGDVQEVNFDLTATTIGDIDGNGVTDLEDAVLVLTVLAGIDATGAIRADYAESGADVSGDLSIGLEELAFILQWVSDARP